MAVSLCEHVMSSGLRCGSPARRGQPHCHYHTSIQTLLPKRFHVHENFRNEHEHGCRLFPMPVLEDATSIQTALMQVIHAMLEGAIPVHTARVVLSALRTAQRNLPAVKLEMAATCAAAVERELPSDARQKAEMTWPNRVDDECTTSSIGRHAVSPDHLHGDLPDREPKILPGSEGDSAHPAPITGEVAEACANVSPSNDAAAPRPLSQSSQSAQSDAASVPSRKKPELVPGSGPIDRDGSPEQTGQPRIVHSG